MYLLIKRYQKVFNKMYTVIISDRGRFKIIFIGHDHIHLYAYLHFSFLWWSSDTFYPRIIFIPESKSIIFFSTGFLKNIFYTCHFTEYVTWTTLWWPILSLKYHCLDSHVQQVLFGTSFYTDNFTECITCSRVGELIPSLKWHYSDSMNY